MPGEQCEALFTKLAEVSPETVQQTVVAAAAALRFRPKFLLKQPVAKRIASVRRALSRVGSDQLAEEILAVYFLKCRLELLSEWLDHVGLPHEEGILSDEEIATPDAGVLEKKVGEFRSASDDADRELLLQAFSAQSAIDWPKLDELVATAAERDR
jgi:hypothetical protein